MEFLTYEGLRSVYNDMAIQLSNDDIEPKRVLLTMKEEGATLDVGQLFREDYLQAIDTGLNEPVIFNPTGTITLGKEVALYLKGSSFEQTYNSYGYTLGPFLSQVDVLHNAFPKNFYVLSPNIIILNEDFTTMEGMFENIGMQAPTFWGSTFKTGPKVYADLSEVSYFPLNTTPSSNGRNVWAPFYDCPNITYIEYQGDLSDNCEVLMPAELAYTTLSGYDSPSAYPGNARPRAIKYGYIIMDKYDACGDACPQIFADRLEIADNPLSINEFSFGKVAGFPTYPVGGIDYRDASLLRYLDLASIPTWTYDKPGSQDDVAIRIGIKALGIDFHPDAPLVYASGLHRLAVYANKRKDEVLFDTIRLSPVPTARWAAGNFAYEFFMTLQTFYGNETELLGIPRVPNSIKYISDYMTTTVYAWDTGSNQMPTPGKWLITDAAFFEFVPCEVTGPDSFGPFTIQPLPEGVEIVDGYLRATFNSCVISTNANVIERYYIDSTVTIPPLPSSVRLVKDFLKFTFRHARGFSVEDLSNDVRIHWFEGHRSWVEPVISGSTPNPYRDDPESMIGNIPEIEFSEYKNYMRMVIGWTQDAEIESSVPQLFAEHNLDIEKLALSPIRRTDIYGSLLTEGVTIQEGPLPNLEVAINWHHGTWFDSSLDPKNATFKPLLQVPLTAKTENSYWSSLAVQAPGPRIIWSKNENTAVEGSEAGYYQMIFGDIDTHGDPIVKYDEIRVYLMVRTPAGGRSTNTFDVPDNLGITMPLNDPQHPGAWRLALSDAYKGELSAFTEAVGIELYSSALDTLQYLSQDSTNWLIQDKSWANANIPSVPAYDPLYLVPHRAQLVRVYLGEDAKLLDGGIFRLGDMVLPSTTMTDGLASSTTEMTFGRDIEAVVFNEAYPKADRRVPWYWEGEEIPLPVPPDVV